MENALVKSLFLGLLASLIYWWARKGTKGSRYILLLSVFTISASLVVLAKCVEYPFILFLLAAGIYSLMAVERQSNTIWVCALLAYGQWHGGLIIYAYGNCYLGLGAPLPFLVLGLSLFVVTQTNFFKHYSMRRFATTTMVIGIIYANIALWILSLVGYHPEHRVQKRRWYDQPSQIQLMGWSLVWLASSVALALYGYRFNRASARRLALVFSITNLYTKFFEYFWHETTQAFFFTVLGTSLCFLVYQMKLYFFPKKKKLKRNI